ncbi:hypothetical protein AVEN_269456-1 [Araneus ventricosus]|uniref:Tc1-like transposase DDE domain-containing protein n=1 Tax=Araneus ventricosus TaxID=182803 RepID=A0A4Y2NS03_ARAVE|nr:hypothetical protein AVEN_269456-1 [Araneus ventricosus]
MNPASVSMLMANAYPDSKEDCGKVAISLSIGCLRKHFLSNRFGNHCRKVYVGKLFMNYLTDKTSFLCYLGTRVEAGRPPVRPGICCREAYGDYTRCDSVGSDLLAHTITSSRSSTHFDGTQLRGRDFNASCIAYAIKSPRCHYQQDNARPHTERLSQQCLQGYDVLPWPSRSPDLSPIDHAWDVLGRQMQPSRNTSELTAQLQILWHDFPQEVIGDLIDSLPRRVLAFIAARSRFTTVTVIESHFPAMQVLWLGRGFYKVKHGVTSATLVARMTLATNLATILATWRQIWRPWRQIDYSRKCNPFLDISIRGRDLGFS